MMLLVFLFVILFCSFSCLIYLFVCYIPGEQRCFRLWTCSGDYHTSGNIFSRGSDRLADFCCRNRGDSRVGGGGGDGGSGRRV